MARAPIGRQQILDSAREELVQGDGVLELAAVTRRAGLSTGAVYHHFGSKLGLLAAIWKAETGKQASIRWLRGIVRGAAEDGQLSFRRAIQVIVPLLATAK